MREIEIQHRHSSEPIEIEGESFEVGRGIASPAMLRARLAQALTGARATGSTAALLCVEWSMDPARESGVQPPAAERISAELVRRLRPHAGPGDCVAREDATHFELLLSHLDAEPSAARIAGAIVHDLAAPVCMDGREIQPQISVGVAVSGTHGQDPAALLDAAHAAQREASELGGDAYLLAR